MAKQCKTDVTQAASDAVHGGDIWGWARRLDIPVNQVLDLSASLNPLGPPPGLAEELSRAFELICHYPDRSTTDLRDAAAAHLGLAPQNILPGNGSTALIRLLSRALDLRNMLIVAPAFGEFGRSFALSGRHFHYYTLKKHLLDRDELFAIWREEPSCVIVTNPMTPTGGLIDIEVLELLLAEAARRRVWVVLDEAFIDFVPDEKVRRWSLTKAAEQEHVVVLRSLTKFYCMAGLRLGLALGTPRTLALLARLGEPWSVNTLAQKAGLFCLGQTEYAETSRAKIAQWRQAQAEMLTGLGLEVYPSQVNYLMCQITDSSPEAADIASKCAEHGVLLRDCCSFPGCHERHLRTAVTDPAGQKKLKKALSAAL